MPTPDFPTLDAPNPAGLDQTSSVCPSSLTPSTEDIDPSAIAQFTDGLAQSDMPAERSGLSEEHVNDNTAAGMIASQEDMLYPTPRSIPDVNEPEFGCTNDTDKTELSHDESADVKAVPVDYEHGGFTASTQSVPISSMLECSPAENTQSGKTITTIHDIRASPKSIARTPSSDARGAFSVVHSSSDENLRELSRNGIPKIDRELNWSSATPGWDFTHKRLDPKYPSSLFQCESRFEGTQQSDRQIYNVSVRILTVDKSQFSCTGYLTIRGLTPEHETLQTYFTGEIIGGPNQRHSFRTKTPEWGASDKTDLTHWARFQAWRPWASQAKMNLDFNYPGNGGNWWQQDNIFMRWKEHFLVPDHRTKSIAGASFEGFYYICLNQVEGRISGIYFHSKSEKYQQLELRHQGQPGRWHHGITPCVEFR